MLARLDEIEADLLARRERAANEGWLGEIEGLDLTPSFLRAKRAEPPPGAEPVAPTYIELLAQIQPS